MHIEYPTLTTSTMMFRNATRKRSLPTRILTKNEIFDATPSTQPPLIVHHSHLKSDLAKLEKSEQSSSIVDFQRPAPATATSCHHISSSRQRSHLYKRTLGYGTIDSMVNSQNHPLSESVPCDEGGFAPGTDRSAGKLPLKFEASTQRQRMTSKSIRLYAIYLCATVALGAVFACLSDGSVDAQLATSPASRSSLIDGTNKQKAEKKPYRMPKVQQSKRLLEEDPEHETMIQKLRDEFHEWVEHHSRDYGSDEEKEKRFHIWKENHFRTQKKNEKHGLCKMTGQAVFGSNHFKDLSPEEFQAKYLTGYTGPHADDIPKDRRKMRSDQFKAQDILKSSPTTKRRVEPVELISSNGLHDPRVVSGKINRHESVQERYLKHVQQTPLLDKTYYNYEEKQNEKACKCYYGNRRRRLSERQNHSLFGKTYYNKKEKEYLCSGYSSSSYYSSSSGSSNSNGSSNCNKYKLEAAKDTKTSNEYEYGESSCSWWDVSCLLKSIFQPIYTTSSERFYSNYNYPTSIDWRKMGAVTSIHSQGSCGACWAITAVETIESANYIATGELLDLSEQEIIVCDDSCEMCNGGWPQNAYSYVMENGGLPKDTSYDGDLLMTMTMVKAGQSDELTENEMESIYEATCPASSGSQKNDSNSSTQRYAAIDTYAYATDRCVCYTDGSGCDCTNQNEVLAVMNVASFGPAAVCLEASTWQDYTGGIITSDSGCSSAFLDMNHCVQAVGYAFQEVESDGDDVQSDNKSDDSGNKQLEGYWIIRNQWSSYWGMNGYAYVAMGSNTCGLLNDMTQVFI